jgi:tRNA G46 methylase TrmB
MVSPNDPLNYVFHYGCATEMSGLSYDSRNDFVTNLHDDSRKETLEKYVERPPQDNILENPDAAIIYEICFGGQEVEVRLEYQQKNERKQKIGVDMEENGKREEFIEQISNALDGDFEVILEEIALQH